MKKIWSMFFIPFSIVLLLVGCVSPQSQSQSTSKTETIEVEDAEKVILGSIMSTSGASNGMGIEGLNGVEFAVEEINKNGGFEVNGQKFYFELKQYDDESDPQKAVSAAERLINQDHAKVLFLPPASSAALATTQVTESNSVISLAVQSATPALTENTKYVFRATPTAVEAEAAKVKYAVENLGAKKFAILARNDDWGKTGATEYKKNVEKFGGEIVAEEYFKPGTTDFYSLLTKIKDKGADAINILAIQNDGVPAVKQAKELGIDAAIFGAVVWNSASFIEAANSEGTYAYSDASTSTTDAITAYIKKFEEATGNKSQTYDKTSYDLVYLLVEAYKAAGSVEDNEKIREALLDIEYQGVNGNYAFRENGEAIIQVNVTQIQDGKAVPVLEIPGEEVLELIGQ